MLVYDQDGDVSFGCYAFQRKLVGPQALSSTTPTFYLLFSFILFEGEGEAATGSSIEIKVAVHILHNDEVAKVQRRYIDDQMAVLNKAYNTAAEECNSEPGEARIGFALSKLSYHNNQKWSE